jgi:hypothetical protein
MNMNKFTEQIINDVDELLTPETFARKLLIDTNDDYATADFLTYCPDNSDPTDQYAYRFEILLIMAMEMIFTLAKINYLTYNQDKEEKDYIPELDKLNIKDFEYVLDKKFGRIGYNLIITKYNKNEDDTDTLNKIANKRHSRIILKHNPDDEFDYVFFEVPENKDYFMIKQKQNENYKKIIDVYALIIIRDDVYKIQFDRFIV